MHFNNNRKNIMNYTRIKPSQAFIENMKTIAEMENDLWIDQDGDVYIQTPGAQAAEMAEEMGIDYSNESIFID